MSKIHDEYFEWLYKLVCENRYSMPIYRRLLMHLHEVEFTFSIPRDRNRAEDGEELRYRFAIVHGYEVLTTVADLGGPCSILEMMVALAIRCEECIMDDSAYGNRMGQWFWGMITNMGLGPMTNDMYDESQVNIILMRFLEREYEPDGRGGLFRIRNCNFDLRGVEIWHQLCWYLDTIL